MARPLRASAMVNVYALYFPNGKRYVGVEKRPGTRLSQHARMISLRKSQPQTVHLAIQKYGWENVKWRYLAVNCTNEEGWALEKAFIRLFRTQEREWGYNRSEGGEHGSSGITQTPTHRARRRASLAAAGRTGTEQLNTAEARARRVATRRREGTYAHSDESRAKMRAAKLGKPGVCASRISLPAGPNGERRWFRPEQLI